MKEDTAILIDGFASSQPKEGEVLTAEHIRAAMAQLEAAVDESPLAERIGRQASRAMAEAADHYFSHVYHGFRCNGYKYRSRVVRDSELASRRNPLSDAGRASP